VGLRDGLDTEVRLKSSATAGDRTSISRSSSPQSDTILTELRGSKWLNTCCKMTYELKLTLLKYPTFVTIRMSSWLLTSPKVGLAWSDDPKSYVGGRVATGRGSHAGQA
jgi:hypothetical protein